MEKLIEYLSNYDYWQLLREAIFSIISSFIFIIILLKIFSPKIKISPYISKKKHEEQEYHAFKIVNKSLFKANGIKFALYKMEPYILGGKEINHRMLKVDLGTTEIYSIGKYKIPCFNRKYDDNTALNKTKVNLSEHINEDNVSYILFVSVTHELSNITKVFEMEFSSSEFIAEKYFCFGNNLNLR